MRNSIIKMTKISNKKIISKYLDSEASEAEVKQLLNWLEKKRNQKTFKDYIKTKLLIDIKFKSFNSQEAIVLFLDEIKLINRSKSKNRFGYWLKYAAIFIGISILSTYAISINNPELSKIMISEITLEINEGDVQVIQLDDLKVITSKNGEEIGSIQNGILTYKNSALNNKKLAYNNILTVPYGKQFDLILADGTIIQLNAGSVLKYPSNFEGNSKREVFLEGEAYFKVAKNKNIPFIVKTENLATRVFGTEFNVSTYANDDLIEVILVEGLVGVQDTSKNSNISKDYVMIKPSQKASMVKTLRSLKVEDVDVDSYIAWRSGVLMFNNEGIVNIFKKLERHFNVEIQNNYHDLYNHSYTGVFKSENLEEVLTIISTHTNFSYSRKGNKIIIKNH
jgi:transmembrane sensor